MDNGTRTTNIQGRMATMTMSEVANQLRDMSNKLMHQTSVTSNISVSYVNRLSSLPIGVVSKYTIGEWRTLWVMTEYNFLEHRIPPDTIQTVLKNAHTTASVNIMP